jgi:putative GTP pyrophosphokinase
MRAPPTLPSPSRGEGSIGAPKQISPSPSKGVITLTAHDGGAYSRVLMPSRNAALAAWLGASGDWPQTEMRMAVAAAEKPAWISKGRVNRAGDVLRAPKTPLTEEDAAVLDAWRAAHRYILNTFQAILRNRTRHTKIVVAQRLKRRSTIVDKLHREPNMQLARMDDIAGCRLIFGSIKSLREFRAKFHKAKFRHKLKNDLDKYDYIKHPKPLGYRGIHDIYEYDSKSIEGAKHKGLLVEIQYRTKCEHAWATAVELITEFTGHEPKFNRGDIKHVEFFKLASEIIARTCEAQKSCFPDISNAELVGRFAEIDSEIHLMAFFRGLQPSTNVAADGVLILHMAKNGQLKIYEYSAKPEAMAAYFDLEKKFPGDNIVLVNADTFAAIRTAYSNYFSDVLEFVRLVDNGCKALEKAP